ncbi:MAG: hypothetical protein AB4426_27330 [Xenococcaceae cyanobacterium]
MKIEWNLDEEEGLDPIDPLGNITLKDEQRTLREECTYLDSWFYAFITGIQRVQAGNSITVDLVEESDPLIFEPSKGRIKISYQNQAIVVSNINEFICILRQSAKDFLLKLDQIQGFANNHLLYYIRDFVNKTE